MDATPQVGARLRAIRRSRNLSLEDTAQLTAVSKPALAQIERGTSSPTVNTLWKIATGLRVPLTFLLQEEGPAFQIVHQKEHTAISECDNAMLAYPLFPYDPVRNVEIFYLEFAPGCLHPSQKHLDGVEEYLFVLRGCLDLTLGREKIHIEENQSIRFQANVDHAYCNPYGQLCAAYNLIFYTALP